MFQKPSHESVNALFSDSSLVFFSCNILALHNRRDHESTATLSEKSHVILYSEGPGIFRAAAEPPAGAVPDPSPEGLKNKKKIQAKLLLKRPLGCQIYHTSCTSKKKRNPFAPLPAYINCRLVQVMVAGEGLEIDRIRPLHPFTLEQPFFFSFFLP